jgi:hypothetical protein
MTDEKKPKQDKKLIVLFVESLPVWLILTTVGIAGNPSVLIAQRQREVQ